MKAKTLFFVVIVAVSTLFALANPVLAMMQEALPFVDIVTMQFAMLILVALAAAFAGTTFAVATRHLTNRNWTVTQEDVWYYVLAGGMTIGLALFGYMPAEIFIATAGVNTPLGLIRNVVDKKSPPSGDQIAKPLRKSKTKSTGGRPTH